MKKVLLLGDSIRENYQDAVTAALAGRAEVVHPAPNGAFASYTLCLLRVWLAELGTPDIVHWNNGIWDTFLRYTEDGPFTPVDEYVRTLSRILRELRKTGAQVVFATSTPCRDPHRDLDSRRIAWYNHEALALMRREGVDIDDLWSTVAADIPNLICADNVHLSDAGKRACAAQVVRSVEKYL